MAIEQLTPEELAAIQLDATPLGATDLTGSTNISLTLPTGPMSTNSTSAPTVVSTYTDQTTGDVIAVYSDGTTKVLSKGTLQTQASQAAAATAAIDKAKRQSAYDLLYSEFAKYGLSSLIEPLKGLITSDVSPSEFRIRLENTDAYKQRFSANQDRIKAGLTALDPATYIKLEDQYQNVMRNYGLPSSYWSKDSMGTQSGFNKLIASDVDPTELENRIITAQKRVINSDPNVMDALRQYYPDITNGDILAYALDPTNALENIKRKVTAAEIGGAAMQQGLGINVNRAEELAKYGVDKAAAQQGYQQIGEFLPTAEKLGDIYAKQGLGEYNQATAEQELFNLSGSSQAAKKRKKLSGLEQAAFSGSSGAYQSALENQRQGSF